LLAFLAWAVDHAGAPCPTSVELGGRADPWDRPYELTCTDQPADQRIGARSSGADRTMGTDDDLVSWALDDAIKLVRGPRWLASPAARHRRAVGAPARPLEAVAAPKEPAAHGSNRSDSDGVVDRNGDGIPDER